MILFFSKNGSNVWFKSLKNLGVGVGVGALGLGCIQGIGFSKYLLILWLSFFWRSFIKLSGDSKKEIRQVGIQFDRWSPCEEKIPFVSVRMNIIPDRQFPKGSEPPT